MKQVVVVDYGLGNILSVVRAFEHLGYEVGVATSPQDLSGARTIVLPGVGAFSPAVRRLETLGLIDSLRKIGSSDTPMLGICLGMQLLFTTGYEHEETKGLGIIDGEVVKMTSDLGNARASKLPEVGWREIAVIGDQLAFNSSILLETHNHYFYFNHSYEVKPTSIDLATVTYRRDEANVIAAVGYNNVYGVQFHPEKSGESGLTLLRNFASYGHI